jgi:hypothetical protein
MLLLVARGMFNGDSPIMLHYVCMLLTNNGTR